MVESLSPLPIPYGDKKSNGSTTTHSDFSLPEYDSFIFDHSINPFPPADRSNFYHEEFADELAHIISPPEYDCFCFKIKPELGNLTMDVVEDIFPTREPIIHVLNVLPTHPTLHLDMDLSSFSYISLCSSDCLDSEASRARSFVLRSQELHILSFNLGNPVS
ncbi:hypothetical protein Tco_0068210 [Tanacetum coccineum]